MTFSPGGMHHPRGIPLHTGHWSERMPERLKNKLAGFERIIGAFPQRRWL